MKFSVLMENTRQDPALVEEHGLSILVTHKSYNYLIDVGLSDGYIKNAKVLGEDLSTVTDIIITHGHLDHGGGLAYLKDIDLNPRVSLKESALDTYYSLREVGQVDIGLSKFKGEPFDFNFIMTPMTLREGVHILSVKDPKKPQPISNGLLRDKSQKLDSFIHELFIVFVEGDDLYVMTGCAHKGFLNIIDETEKHFPDKKIKALIGGLHLYNKVETEENYKTYLDSIESYFSPYKSVEVFTGHCTGQPAIDYFCDKGYNIKQLYTGLKHTF